MLWLFLVVLLIKKKNLLVTSTLIFKRLGWAWVQHQGGAGKGRGPTYNMMWVGLEGVEMYTRQHKAPWLRFLICGYIEVSVLMCGDFLGIWYWRGL